MKYFFFILSTFGIHFTVHSQNISIDRIPHKIIGMDLSRDTAIYLTKFEQRKTLNYSVILRVDSVIFSGRTFFHADDLDAKTRVAYDGKMTPPLAGYKLKDKAKIKVKKEFANRVGMMPTFGRSWNKKKPGRYKQVGYRVKIESQSGTSYEGIVYYFFQKQSFFKRFFKKRKLKHRFKKLPVFLDKEGLPEVIFKNDIIEEGGQVRNLYYNFKLKLGK